MHKKVQVDVYDDDGIENISFKNGCYCELTAVYWLWKNSKDNYLGLCHYRRFFSKGFIDSILKKPVKYDALVRLLNESDVEIIVRKSIFYKKTIGEIMDSDVHAHANALEKILKREFPEYTEAWKLYRKNHGTHGNNMFFAKKTMIDQYFEWLFSILNSLEKMPDGINPSDQSRDAGYIAEYLFNVWLIYNRIRIKEMDVTNLDTGMMLKVGARVRDYAYKLHFRK